MGVGSARSSRLGVDAAACLEKALQAVEPEALVADAFATGDVVVPPESRIRLAAFGKAGAAMARGARRALGGRLDGGVVVVPEALKDDVPSGFEVFGGGHPVPNRAGIEGAAAMADLAVSMREGDVLLVLVSGGGSALLTLPPAGVDLDDLQRTTRDLLRAGATIGQLNAVRKHLDRLKGGRLARLAAPARVVALVLSDVVGDPLDVIASGPVSPDPTTFADARGVLESYGLWTPERLAPAVRRHLDAGLHGRAEESPGPGDPCFDRTEVHVVGNNRRAAEAALAEAKNRGYRPLLLTTTLTGEAREVAKVLTSGAREIRASGQPVKAPACLVAAGETTVTVTGDGLGGRNQELALATALALEGEPGILAACVGTDGIDGPTDAAGAMVDGGTVRRARAAGLDPDDHLLRNDAYRFFEPLGDLVITGPTGTNVMDLALFLVEP